MSDWNIVVPMRRMLVGSCLRFLSYLLACSCFDKVCFGNNLDGVVLASVHGSAKIHLGESSFTEHSSTDVTMRGMTVTIGAASTLFNDDTLSTVLERAF